jgi:molybdate transport system substrate-binding protein
MASGMCKTFGRALVIASTIWLSAFTPAHAEQLTVAAAADLTFAFQNVAAQFEQQTGNNLRVSYGSSGNFFAQIRNGAPYDVFFSADVKYPRKLEAAGLTEPGSIYEYAAGKIVLWVPNSSTVDLSQGFNALLDPGMHKIAIANPAHAPYGRAAVAALEHDGIYEKIKGKLVMGEDIAQTAQFVQSGNADVGIVALSLALAPPMKSRGRYVMIPATDYPPIIQAAVVIKASRHQELAQKFLEFMKQPATVAQMGRFGFIVPTGIASSGAMTSH